MKKQILALIGLPGAGKTTASLFFAKKNIPVVSLGKLTLELLNQKKLETGEKNESIIRNQIRDELGKEAYVRLALPKIIKYLADHSLVVIEGVRSFEELDYLKTKIDIMKSVFIEADENLRYQRLEKRKVRPLTRKLAKERDLNERGTFGTERLKKVADFLIENKSDFISFYKNLENVLEIM